MPAPTITFRLPKEQEAALAALSEVTGKPVGELVRDSVNKLLAEQDLEQLMADLQETRARQDRALAEALKAAKAVRAEIGTSNAGPESKTAGPP